MSMNENKKKAIKAICLVVLILVSVFGLSRIVTSPKTYTHTLKNLQEKENTVAKITTGAVVAATAIAAIPSDTTTPIANHILEISSYLIIVNCAISLEKSVITLLGGVSSYGLIPFALLLLLISLFKKDETNHLKNSSFKVLAFALTLLFIIPVSVWAGDMVVKANKDAVEQVVIDIEESGNTDYSESESKLTSFLNSIKRGTNVAVNKLEELNTKFVSAITIFIVSNCLIPIAVIAFVMWLIKILFGISIRVPKHKSLPRFTNKNISNAITPDTE